MNRLIATLIVASMPFAAVSTVSAAEAPTQQQSVQKELQKLMNARGAGEISAKDYKLRKEALLKGATTQLGANQ